MNKQIQVNLSKTQFSLLNMPKPYRSNLSSREANLPAREGEIKLSKVALDKTKKIRLLIKDEKEKTPYQSEKFNQDQMNLSSSLILTKITKNSETRYVLAFGYAKYNCYKHEDQNSQQRRFGQIDKGLDARRKAFEYERVAQRTKQQMIQQVPEYEQEQLSSSESDRRHKNDYRLNSDSEKAQKKVKIQKNSSDFSEESIRESSSN